MCGRGNPLGCFPDTAAAVSLCQCVCFNPCARILLQSCKPPPFVGTVQCFPLTHSRCTTISFFEACRSSVPFPTNMFLLGLLSLVWVYNCRFDHFHVRRMVLGWFRWLVLSSRGLNPASSDSSNEAHGP